MFPELCWIKIVFFWQLVERIKIVPFVILPDMVRCDVGKCVYQLLLNTVAFNYLLLTQLRIHYNGQASPGDAAKTMFAQALSPPIPRFGKALFVAVHEVMYCSHDRHVNLPCQLILCRKKPKTAIQITQFRIKRIHYPG